MFIFAAGEVNLLWTAFWRETTFIRGCCIRLLQVLVSVPDKITQGFVGLIT